MWIWGRMIRDLILKPLFHPAGVQNQLTELGGRQIVVKCTFINQTIFDEHDSGVNCFFFPLNTMGNNQPGWWSVGFARKAEHRQTHFRCVGGGSAGPEGGAGIGCVVQGSSKNCAIRPLVPSRSDLSSQQKPNLMESKEINQGWQGSPGKRNAWMP